MKSLKTNLIAFTSLLVTIALVSSNAAVAKPHTLCNFLPKNNLRIPVGLEQQGGIDEATFNKVIDKVAKYYEPIIKAHGATLKVNRLWKDPTVNASAQQDGHTWILNMYGGLARHRVVNAEGFSLVVCHELGHHLGGFPRKGDRWASNEGQSDYFATMKCFRRINEKQSNQKYTQQVPASVKKQCSVQFKSAAEIALCARGAMGGMNLATLLWTLENGGLAHSDGLRLRSDPVKSAKPSFETPDPAQVSHTDDAHPHAQCRLDTYFNGAACGVAFTEDFDKDSATPGACAQEKGDTMGYRPHCWYKPSK